MTRPGLLFLALLAWGGLARADSGPGEVTLCLPSEAVLFACDLGTRRVALCRPLGSDAPLVYRYGRPGKLELEHRSPPTGFWRRERPTYGGSEIEVGFARRGWDYRLFARVGRSAGSDADERVPEFEDGLQVGRSGSGSGSDGRRRACVDGGAGFRTNLDFVPARP